jgi:hypothetical protein
MLTDGDLATKVGEFADQITDTVQAVLGHEEVALRATLLGDLVLVSSEGAGITLTCAKKPLLTLRVRFHCGWDSSGSFIAVRRSEFHVLVVGESEPVLRVEYDRDAHQSLPTAHLHVHAHRDATTWAMSNAGNRTRRSRQRRKSGVPALKELHFPLGGTRFRPALEDVMQLLVEEFGVDAADDWQGGLAAGRAEWRRMQTRAAVRDAPEEALAALRALGYTVVAPTPAPIESPTLGRY